MFRFLIGNREALCHGSQRGLSTAPDFALRSLSKNYRSLQRGTLCRTMPIPGVHLGEMSMTLDLKELFQIRNNALDKATGSRIVVVIFQILPQRRGWHIATEWSLTGERY